MLVKHAVSVTAPWHHFGHLGIICGSGRQRFLTSGCVQVLDKHGNVQISASRTEASARTAFEELMMEEDQAAAKVAAKKAKKLKQKVKKKSKQQAATAEPATRLGSEDEEEEEEEDQFRLPQAAASHTSLGSEAAVEVPSAEQLPSALRVLQADTVPPTTAPGRAVLTTDGAEPQQLPLLDAHGLNHPEDATSIVPAALEQENGSSSMSHNTAGADKEDSDAQFLQALFCCPITKVSAAAVPTRINSAHTHMQRAYAKPEHSQSCTVAVAMPSKQAQASKLAQVKGIAVCLLPTLPMQAPNTFGED